jgi:hypothetical protein
MGALFQDGLADGTVGRNLTLTLITSQSRQSLETAVRRVRGWCEMAASLRGCEPGSRGTSIVGSRYQAAQ